MHGRTTFAAWVETLRRNSPELWLAALLLLGYVAARAGLLSLTHDEASTWAHALDYENLWACWRSPHCWDTANLHWLNTWLMQGSMALFGDAEWALRLPNLLALGLYLAVLIRLLRRHTDRLWLRWAGLALLATHPYFLEFFGLARGYGLACAFLLLSWERWEAHQMRRSWGTALGCWLAVALAVLSHFTLLPFYCALLGLSALSGWMHGQAQPGRGLRAFRLLGVGCLVGLGLGALIGYPLALLSEGIEFTYGATSLRSTFYSLIVNGLQGRGYLGGQTSVVVAWLLTPLTLGALGGGLWRTRRFGAEGDASWPGMAWLLLGVSVILVLQFFLLGTFFLENRTALLMVPMWGYLLWQGLLGAYQWRPRLGLITGGVIVGLALWHLGGTANLSKVREWYYDAQTKAVAAYLAVALPSDRQIQLGTHWKFCHTMRYYVQTGHLPQEADGQIPYEKTLQPAAAYDYYYVPPEDASTLQPGYEVVKHFGKVGVLCRRRESPIE